LKADEADLLARKLFYVIVGGVVVYAAVVITFILSVN
jgi:hypothetical protein